MKVRWFAGLLFVFVLILGWSLAWADNVKITPLGSQADRFCRPDRALLFEDPKGVRILIAPGRTVNGSGDPRLAPLGSVHVLLIDHPHTDHWGDVRQNCAGAKVADFAFPNQGNAPEIAANHKSAVLVGGELPDFATQKIKNITGAVPAGCPAVGLDNILTVPLGAPCVGVIRGGTRTVALAGQPGVKITTIPAFHAAGVPRVFIDAPNVPEGLTGNAGSEGGYIIRFTNGLSVLWTGDSGLIGDWATQSDFYDVNLAVVHMGDLFTMGADEAAYAVAKLIRPESVIPEHANETPTADFQVTPRVQRFKDQLRQRDDDIKVVIPFSDNTFEFNGRGRCVSGPGC